MTESFMYWLTRLDQIRSFLGGIQLLAAVFGVIGFIALCVMSAVRDAYARYNRPGEGHVDADYYSADQAIKALRRPWLACVAAALACSLALTFIPTTKEMAAIKVVPALAGQGTAEKLKAMSSDMVDVAAQWLKDAKEKRK